MIMRGIKITQGKAPKSIRLITPREVWEPAADYDTTMLWAAAMVCFMKDGKLMVTQKEDFDTIQHMTLDDVATESQTKSHAGPPDPQSIHSFSVSTL